MCDLWAVTNSILCWQQWKASLLTATIFNKTGCKHVKGCTIDAKRNSLAINNRCSHLPEPSKSVASDSVVVPDFAWESIRLAVTTGECRDDDDDAAVTTYSRIKTCTSSPLLICGTDRNNPLSDSDALAVISVGFVVPRTHRLLVLY